jgi:hypothetical protein
MDLPVEICVDAVWYQPAVACSAGDGGVCDGLGD